MSYSISSLYKLKKKDIKKAAEVFTRAFYSDPLAQYMFPDGDFRREILPIYFEYRIKFGILYGEVFAPSPKIEGLAVWYLSDQFKMTNWRNFRAGGMKLFMKVDKETVARMFKIGHFSTEFRESYTTSRYWYLAPIGIDPIHQGKGFASILMRSMLTRIDSEKLPCLLETQTTKNVEIYKKYGFETIKETTLPGTNIPHWLMVRNSQ